MASIAENHMNTVYKRVVHDLLKDPDRRSETRKGEMLSENLYYEFTLLDINNCVPSLRPEYNWGYLEKEFGFYCSGSNRLEDALELSKFWAKCSDDGETITSNYGKLLLRDRNDHGNTQFEYCLQALINNKDSKKAVMVIYDKEHAFLSNDNPCTMFLHFCILGDKLHMKTHMRSNDIWYGIVYDVPFFCAIQNALYQELKVKYPELKCGSYTHYACSLHLYERDENKVIDLLNGTAFKDYSDVQKGMIQYLFSMVHATATGRRLPKKMSKGMEAAWAASQMSRCLKKKCGAALVYIDEKGQPIVLSTGYGGKEIGGGVGECTECARDRGLVFHGDGCWSVHAEMRAYMNYIAAYGLEHKPEHLTMYVTHGPCDACMKFMDYVGIRRVIFDVPYKTDFGHWPRIMVVREACSNEPGKAPDIIPNQVLQNAHIAKPKCFGTAEVTNP